jgi:hypothetical protein
MFQELMKANIEKVDFTIENVRETYQEMYNGKHVSPILKISLKAWLYHSESRHRNNNPPFQFDHYTHAIGKQTILEYIEFDLIDCEDLGGKEQVKEIVGNWYRY